MGSTATEFEPRLETRLLDAAAVYSIPAMTTPRLSWLLISAMPLFSLSARGQGSLTPPGAPSPSMKTLDQVEPRTIVNATNTPGDANALFIINSSGSYYLTGNILGVGAKHGIVIAADNVSLDLNGFALIAGVGSYVGIIVSASHKNLHIHHGSVIGWPGNGIQCHLATNSQFDHLRISQGASYGILCGDGSMLSAITAEGNGAGGIITGSACTLTGCCAVNNLTGISANNSCTLTASTSKSNSFNGFNLGNDCTIMACTADSNSASGFTLHSNSEIKDCTASRNSGNGIQVLGQGSRVDANNVVDNGTGLDIDSSGFPGGNLVIRNSLRGNGSVGVLSANTMNGPFITISDIITNSNPHANYLLP